MFSFAYRDSMGESSVDYFVKKGGKVHFKLIE